MMLSERELELSGEHEGIMLLPDDLAPGTPLAEVLPIADQVLEFEITSNRPDCLSVYGIAREVSASLDADLAPWPGTEPEASGDGSVDTYVTARIDAPDLCPRWAARVFTDVKVGPSPPWLKARGRGRRHAVDLERRGHHQLRDAVRRRAHPRLRPGQGGRPRDHRPAGHRR